MKVFTLQQNHLLLRCDMGESVWEELQAVCKKRAIGSATFTVIGACKEIILSFYDLEKKVYRDRTFSEDMEILTITGNIAQMEKEYIIHAHGSFGNDAFSVVGGHIKKLIVSATCEVSLFPSSPILTRKFDEKTGLNLLD